MNHKTSPSPATPMSPSLPQPEAPEAVALELRLVQLRRSFDARAEELGRRGAEVRRTLDVAERIRQRPVRALALAASLGASAALLRPSGAHRRGPTAPTAPRGRLGRMVTALLLDVGRHLATELAGQALQALLPDREPDRR